jgi:soluble lytic murein transglycosylase-like protein
VTQSEIIDAIRSAASKNQLDPDLLVAIGSKESSLNALPMRFEPRFRWFFEPEAFAKQLGTSVTAEKTLQASSFGALQVMGAVARELGHAGWLTELIATPGVAIDFGARHFRRLLARYDTMPAAIAAYNAGSPRKINGRYENQEYVDDVLARFNRLKRI